MRRLAARLFLLSLTGCGDDAPAMPDASAARPFGAPCLETNDCSLGLCLTVSASRSVCTKPCASDADCPGMPSWACIAPAELGARVCGCVATGDSEVCGDGIDNDCDGATDDCRICNGRPVPENDPTNCGECGVVCRGDQECLRGVCACADPSLASCSDACADLSSSRVHCGACERACALGQVCQAGDCVCPPPGPPDHCDSAGCVDFDTDGSHCGGCDRPCGPAQLCRDGTCVCPEPDETFCIGVGCVNLREDPAHCGTCSETCDPGTSCLAGACACPVATPSFCGDRCIDTRTDRNHCGRCDRACPASLVCMAGSCVCGVPGTEVCVGVCRAVATDPLHCGECGNACLAGEVCRDGACVCESGLYCDGVCVSASDRTHCGACGRVCGPLQACTGGRCTCSSGRTECGSDCVDLASDPLHCGGCGRACGAGLTCVSGTCRCPTGTFCPGAGACVDLRSSATNCGACGHTCRPGETCSAGACECPSGSRFCASVGACVDIGTNPSHCGACDRACRPTETCSAGACECPGSLLFCSPPGSCVDAETDEANCGRCGEVCPATMSCTAGRCDCTLATRTRCGSTCVDTRNDESHCGACDRLCPGTMTCVSSDCTCAAPTVTPSTLVDSAPAGAVLRSATDGNHLAVTWLDPAGGRVRFALINGDGVVVPGTLLELAAGAVGPDADITWMGSDYGVVWAQPVGFGENLFLQRISASGAAVGSPLDLHVTMPGARPHPRTRIAFLPGTGLAAVGGTFGGCYFQSFGLDGSSAGPVVVVPDASATAASDLLAVPGAGFAAFLIGRTSEPMVQPLEPDGTIRFPRRTIPGGRGVAFDGTGVVAIGYDGAHRVYRGARLDVATLVAVPSPAGADESFVDARAGQVATAFRLARFGMPSLVGHRFEVPVGAESPLTPLPPSFAPSDSTSVSARPLTGALLSGNRLVLVWIDTRATGDQIRASSTSFPLCP